jgi:signal transduction histidine kinase
LHRHPKDAFEDLRRDIASAYAVILDQKKQSKYLCRTIASHIKAGNGMAAWDLFNGNRLLLQQHLDQARFFSLESNVQKARHNFLTRQNRAQSLANAIDSLLDRSRIEEANAQFQDIKKRLKTDLADDKRFSALKDRLSDAYADLRAKQQITRILSLLAQNQVEEAYDAFNSVEADLRFYLEPFEYESIKTRVEASNSALKGKKKKL